MTKTIGCANIRLNLKAAASTSVPALTVVTSAILGIRILSGCYFVANVLALKLVNRIGLQDSYFAPVALLPLIRPAT